MTSLFENLSSNLNGELYIDLLHKSIYATDASVYRKLPLAICYPKNKEDLKILIAFANEHKITLIPRTAGTSLAGQVVGEGIIVDTSKYFTNILEFDETNRTIVVEPGVIRDELNLFLKPYGLFFSPNTSTSNRCMIGGMVGNNSSGTTSIQYGVTRDKVLSLKTILSDGSETTFEALNELQFKEKARGAKLENKIYHLIQEKLTQPEIQEEIHREYPKKTIHRRNNGYAVDALLDAEIFGGQEKEINLSKLLCGSEGTLSFTTEIKLKLDLLPPAHSVMVAAHFESIKSSMEAVVIAMKHNLYYCELMDKTILDCTKNNREQIKNRFFVEGDPKAILMLEVSDDDLNEAETKAGKLVQDLQQHKLGYAFPILKGNDIHKANELRKAGLGLLGNIIGDDKTAACIEDTAVALADLPSFIQEFSQMMETYGQKPIYYAHAGAGELHLRPILNLKKKKGVEDLRAITTDVAKLVKKYKGSMSGEHGDGIVRSEFISMMIGKKNYALLKEIKHVFDPNNIFNKGKIIDPYPMDQSLRYVPERIEPEIETLMDFSDSLGILRVAEKCNGSGDCRKPISAGGTMCPSYRATKNEKDTTRARANALREFLTNSDKKNKFNHKELKEVFDLCLSCKACASECPSNVDVASLKAEFLYQYYKSNPVDFRTSLFADNVKYNRLGMLMPKLTNLVLNTTAVKNIIGIHPKRSIPKLQSATLRTWLKKNKHKLEAQKNQTKSLYLFIDEFTNYYDVSTGIDAIELLIALGYNILVVDHPESGRSAISKGLIDKAKVSIDGNIAVFKDLVSNDTPLVGIEPSTILGFRDEYLRLAEDKESAKKIAAHALTIEEFFEKEFKAKRISSEKFSEEKKQIKIHGHCQQKSLSGTEASFVMLNIPKNYEVAILTTGCCGMAGSFGYEKEHYDLSMQVGEDTLFPKVRNLNEQIEVAAAGTSCRHQIWDGTKRKAAHPVTILRAALK
ncbi:FAD-binding and (Fe-S)-binding domain-containing protein [Namhaeicola litoreus]|uniref:FAD-binding and (Fe-S)-binding domain-containing protein n=1 Tax=Namhaeicola litoreus TaxID=1052145 RepID=A0ABW3Y7V2_9FLAO